MKMPSKIIGVFIASFLLLFSSVSDSEDTVVQKETPVFTDQDIEKYRKPSDNKKPFPIKSAPAEAKKDRTEKIKGDKDREYWCRNASHYKRQIKRAQDDIQDTERELSEIKDSSIKKKKAVEKKLEQTKRKLRYAEEDLDELEREAHRKGIPPGWLRCQFD